MTKKGLLSLKWMDKRAVTMISTIHDNILIFSRRLEMYCPTCTKAKSSKVNKEVWAAVKVITIEEAKPDFESS